MFNCSPFRFRPGRDAGRSCSCSCRAYRNHARVPPPSEPCATQSVLCAVFAARRSQSVSAPVSLYSAVGGAVSQPDFFSPLRISSFAVTPITTHPSKTFQSHFRFRAQASRSLIICLVREKPPRFTLQGGPSNPFAVGRVVEPVLCAQVQYYKKKAKT